MTTLTRRDALVGGASLTAGLIAPFPLLSQEAEAGLYDAAKKEGTVVFYGGITPNAQDTLKKGFQAKYPGINVELLYLSGAPMMTRIVSEAQANRHLADVIMFDANRFSELHKMKLLANYVTQADQYDPKWYSDPAGYWIQP